MDKRVLLMELAAPAEEKEKGITASMTWGPGQITTDAWLNL